MQKYLGELGAVSKGHLIEADRSKLVAKYAGQTAIKTRNIIEQAKGGVLFLDEVCSLSRQQTNDFGIEAIDTLVKFMEDYRADLIVVVAGYDNEMKEFIDRNPGLASRFNKYIDFCDYTGEELMGIMKYICYQNEFILSEEAIGKLSEIYSDVPKDFGNARGVRNLFEKIIIKQSNRLVKIKNATYLQIQTIIAEDIVYKKQGV